MPAGGRAGSSAGRLRLGYHRTAAAHAPRPLRRNSSDDRPDVHHLLHRLWLECPCGRLGVDAIWSREKGTLLELAEEAGLAPAFGCRSGICSTCKINLSSGAVDYLEEPLASRGQSEVLLCCSVPRQAPGRQPDSYEPDVILDL
ncbi:MAG: 2Fe-2S iron-sulfur cluster binding domain-containing protein [Deltaproteobacteria bacterium]|nr:2Fe-2S iron-sulfur cluster binding domain-containing protein [Deltaproteobacteria bacterium]